MRYTKGIALVLAVVLSAALLAGCGDLDALQRQYQQKHPYQKAFETLEPETVMFTVGAAEVTWQELFHWIFYNATQYEAENGDITDWNMQLETGKTVAEHILDRAVSNCLEYAYVEAAAAGMGLSVNANMREAAQDQVLADAAEYENYDAFVQAVEAEYSTEEYYLYTKLMSAMYSAIYYQLYGSGGEFLPEQEILDYTADDGYMMTKIIRMYFFDPETGAERTEEEREEMYTQCQWIVEQLGQCTTDEEVEARFTELMLENTEDTGVEAFPNGYLFQERDLNQVFVSAVKELELYEYTDVLVSDDSYAVMLRIPINVDVVPLANAQYFDYGYTYSLRYLVSVDMYNDTVRSWTEKFPAEFAPEYEALDLAALLTKE